MKTPFLLCLLTSAVCLADGPVGPVIGYDKVNAVMRKDEVQRRQAEIAAGLEAEKRAQQVEIIRRDAELKTHAAAEEKFREAQRRIAERNRIAQTQSDRRRRLAERQTERRDRLAKAQIERRASVAAKRAREAEERKHAAWLASQWRVILGKTTNLLWPDWRHIQGVVRETQSEGLLVETRSEKLLLMRYGELADGETVDAYATSVGLHRYQNSFKRTETSRKYDCGVSCSPPAEWLKSAPARQAAEAAKLAAESDADRAQEERMTKDETEKEERLTKAEAAEEERMTNADTQAEERIAQAEATEIELESARRRAQEAAVQARIAAAQSRVIAYQNQQASNGYPSFQYELGKRYLKGDGVPKDWEMARHWLESACTNRLSEASNLLATIKR